MQNYKVKVEGFILGDFKAKGSTIQLEDRQAREFLREGRIEVKEVAKATVPAEKPLAKIEKAS